MRYLILFFIFYFAVFHICGQELNGIVKNINGKPIENVSIFPEYVESDKDGRFALEKQDYKFLIFSKDGFRPMVKKLSAKSVIEVLLETESKTDKLIIPECAVAGKYKKENISGNISLFVPKELKIKKGKDIDYVNFYVFSKKDQNNFLQGWQGPNASSGYPDNDWINSSSQIFIRTISNNQRNIGLDFYGRTDNGKSWCFVRVFDESIFIWLIP